MTILGIEVEERDAETIGGFKTTDYNLDLLDGNKVPRMAIYFHLNKRADCVVYAGSSKFRFFRPCEFSEEAVNEYVSMFASFLNTEEIAMMDTTEALIFFPRSGNEYRPVNDLSIFSSMVRLRDE